MHYHKGFTLIELMITIAVLAIVISMAAPSFSNVIQASRLAALNDDLQGAIQLARSEAIKRHENVSVCRSNNSQNSCDNGTDWAGGWLVVSESQQVLKLWTPAQGMQISGPSESVHFYSDGMSSAENEWTVSPAECTGNNKSKITVKLTGYVTVEPEACI